MKLGAENRRKVILLGGLLLMFLYVLYTNVLAPGDDTPVQTSRTQTPVQQHDPATIAGLPTQPQPEVRPRPSFRGNARTGMQFKMNGAAKGLDPATIDPTLRLDLLTKVQNVTLEGGERNLFQFGSAPMPKTPEPKILPKPASVSPPGMNTKPADAVKPPPPPIPLRFYGYSQAKPGEKRAFFLDGEEIVVATEGELVRRRYKVIRIGINSVVMEDTQSNSQQTLPLQEPLG